MILKRYKSGSEVLQAKKRLVELGFLEKATHSIYGNDTYNAVKAFQKANGLEIDGIIGPMTWAALFDDEEPNAVPEMPPHLSNEVSAAIARDLSAVSRTRREIVINALQFAVDPVKISRPRCFYIRGGNLYGQDLALNKMSKSALQKYFAKPAYLPYYEEGKPMMEAFAAESGYTIPGADCSGFIVGLWRAARVCSAGFDANANSLFSSFCVKTEKPIPGDLAWRSGHIGLYCGGGYICESIGGSYCVQVTKASKRRAYNFVDKKIHSFGAWTAYGDPKKY